MPIPLSDTEPGWACALCEEEFDDRDECEAHEAECEGDGKDSG